MADVKQTIQDFYTQAQAKDFARNNLFRVININFGDGSTTVINETDLVYARTASLPAKQITNVPATYMGLQFNIPGVSTYPGSDSYQINFYSDEAQKLREKFLNVLNDTFNDANSTGNYFTPKQTAVIDLVQLNKQLNKIAQYQLVGVSIRDVQALEYDMTATGEIQNFNVGLAYHYWRKTG
jgi:hypothetical protein